MKNLITAQQLIDSYKGKEIKINYLVKQSDGFIHGFTTEPQIEYTRCALGDVGWWKAKDRKKSPMFYLDIAEFVDKDWKECIYKAKEDETKWLGKICYFWDREVDQKDIDILIAIDGKEQYVCSHELIYKHCRPVRKDEVEFAE